MNGLLYINKPSGMTSFDVVAKIRKAYKTKSVGHTGTLDPQATGVLLVMLNKACKANPYLMHDKKEYIATLRLGKKYDTKDIWGKVIEEKAIRNVDFKKINSTLLSFLGKQLQVPPMYSAVKVQGKKLYEYARENKEVEVTPRAIEIYEIECLSVDEDIKFRVVCSSGTYIRVLCEDIALKLGNIGAMSSLVRTKIDTLSLEDCIDLEDILSDPPQPHALYDVLSKLYETVEISSDKLFEDIKNGKKINVDSNQPILCLVKDKEVIAMYEKEDELYRSKRGLW